MNGKISRDLRKQIERKTGINPIGSSFKLYWAKANEKQKQRRSFFIVDPNSPRGMYKALKKAWKH